jgi:hypothetical protein
MNDDYLWDRSGEPDPDVERLERVLGEFRNCSNVLVMFCSPDVNQL